jgi:hypothetical protein
VLAELAALLLVEQAGLTLYSIQLLLRVVAEEEVQAHRKTLSMAALVVVVVVEPALLEQRGMETHQTQAHHKEIMVEPLLRVKMKGLVVVVVLMRLEELVLPIWVAMAEQVRHHPLLGHL